MIVESVVLPVKPGFEPGFERAFHAAEPLIARQPGYVSHSLRRGVEEESTYLLTVEWETVEDHEVGFRESPDYQEWKALLHPFYEPVPEVLHYGDDLAGPREAWVDEPGDPDDAALVAFWERCREAVPGMPAEVPAAWAFGGTRAQASKLLELVLAGVKTGTASALWDFEADDDPLPEVGEVNIIVDADGVPRAVVQTTDIRVVRFHEVDEQHAASEGEGDLSLAHWREVHAEFWDEYSTAGFSPEMPVVCERFRLVHSEGAPRP
ncbi:ASCH domain-containing protein [Demequina capsici]|uniref:ASCH domain-containing protein n=1 Tax=Demequina capsici TaxID=3075620 RepID=A0AA96F7I2_9MICO|nr:ASCH domain-containing protein [Demequina sp. OYTSA14]WNM24709.1 ASCH domain-containing protein [Demequina sp. OYTSA14]